MNFYTNVQVKGNKILYRGYYDGGFILDRLDYEPSLFLPDSTLETPYRTIYNEPLKRKQFLSISEQKDYLKNYEDTGMRIYGNKDIKYCYIADNFEGDIDYDFSKIHYAFIDIETECEDSFPNVHKADQPINAMTMYSSKLAAYIVFTVKKYGEWNNLHGDSVKHVDCVSEEDMLLKFLRIWSADYPDIVSGWNSKGFDIPYIVNRICRMLSEKEAKRLSPWGIINEKNSKDAYGNDKLTYEILGISHLDYLEVYKKYRGKNQASYKLDAIAKEELGEGKISYEEDGPMHLFYKNNYSKFMDYNLRDVQILKNLDEKYRFLETVVINAFTSKVNFEDTFSPVKYWDVIIFNYLREKKIAIPFKNENKIVSDFEGGYVKEPLKGLHEWVVSLDLTSLYPHLIMQYCISPESIQSKRYDVTVDKLLSQEFDTSQCENIIAANGCTYKYSEESLLPDLMKKFFAQRKEYKKRMQAAEKKLAIEYSKSVDEEKVRYNLMQNAKKIQINSLYGILGNQYFRYYDVRNAEAITLSGQLTIRWIAKKLNEYLNLICQTKNVDYVIASDTDSVILTFGKLIENKCPDLSTEKKCEFLDRLVEQKVNPYIEKCFIELSEYMNCPKNYMDMKREVIADKALWKAKKKYVAHVLDMEGTRYEVPKLKIMGLESVTSKFPKIISQMLEETYKIIVTSEVKDIKKNVLNKISQVETLFNKMDIEDISFTSSISGLSKYSDYKTIYKKSTPIYVRGSLLYNHYIEKNKLKNVLPLIKDGDKVKYIYLKTPNTIGEDIIAYPQTFPKQIVDTKYVDKKTMFFKMYKSSISDLLSVMGLTLTNSLFD